MPPCAAEQGEIPFNSGGKHVGIDVFIGNTHRQQIVMCF